MDAPETAASKRPLVILAAALLAGGLGSTAGWLLWIKPQRDAAELRYRTVQDVAALFELQLRYRRTTGTFASNLNALLSLSPSGASMKAAMGRHLDLATLAIVGDPRRFKIEANVLDAERTLIKVKGPILNRAARAAPSSVPPALPPPENADGAPIESAR